MICELSCLVIVLLWLPLYLMIVAAVDDHPPDTQRWRSRSSSPVYRVAVPSSAATSSGSPVREGLSATAP